MTAVPASPEPSEVTFETTVDRPTFAAGRYVARRKLGEGGQKLVYLVIDTALDRECALAVVKTEALAADGLARVSREAQAMARLGAQPNIVTVFDIGHEEDGRPYLVCEYVSGGDLRQALRTAGGPLPLDRALTIASEIARGLAVAHGHGIVHRDLKPANVWLTDHGTAKLGDFGLASAVDQSRLTITGTVMGTAAYMSPEQALGTSADARSDLYGLGAVLYEMITGRPPFLGDDALAVISQHINTAPVAPSWHNPAVPRALEVLVLRLLAKSPDERPESGIEVAEELERVRGELGAETVPAPEAAADLRGLAWGQFAGRRDEMEQLKAALTGAMSGRGALLMLAGEPGIGKTRLAQEFAVYARLRGAQVLTGHCYEGEASLPHRPFVEALRHYARARSEPRLRDELGAGAPEIAALVSEIRQRLPDIAPAPPLEGEAARLRLFDSVTQFVRNAAAAAPLVLVLDDLHWADPASLLLLRYLAHEIAAEPVLIVGTYRDVELDRTHPLADTIATLRREPHYKRVALRGLSEEDVHQLLQAMEPSDEASPARHALASGLFRETEGNPFFIREVLSHLVEEGKLLRRDGHWTSDAASMTELGIPEGVREVIGRRLSRLSDGCNRLLTLASMLSDGFSWQTLTAVSGEDESTLLDLIDEALAAQLIYERKGEGIGIHDFTHALVRQTLYDELSGPRRVVMHRRIAETLERTYAANIEPHVPELAYHFYQAAPGGDVQKAIEYAGRAGARAMAVYAYEEAAAHAERALQLADLSDAVDASARCELLLTLADARLKAGDTDAGNATITEAARIAKTVGSARLLGRAALAYGGAGVQGAFRGAATGIPDQALIGLLRATLDLLGDDEHALESRVLARLASALEFSDKDRERQDLSARALALASECRDAEALVAALEARHLALSMPEGLDERLQITAQLLQLAETTGDLETAFVGHFWRIPDLLEAGDVDGADREITAREEISSRLRQRGYLWFTPMQRAMRATMCGRFAESEQLSAESVRVAQGVEDLNAVLAFAINVASVRVDQGRGAEVAEGIKSYADQNPANPAWRCGVPYVLLQSGCVDEATAAFERVATDDLPALPQDLFRHFALGLLADVAAAVGPVEHARTLYELLAPYAGRCIILSYGSATVGAADRLRGMLAARLRMWDEAERHFEDALEMNRRMGARPWLARTQLSYAEMLLTRAKPGDRERATALLQQSLEAAGEMGMTKVAARSQELLARAG
ncbi:MAG: AAA family ATPase [Chloroflexota bacterium]|nr:AAA family ATPase [Chloroflexota bacterium]